MSKLYIANDVESAGPLLGPHPPLSWAACVVAQDKMTPDEMIARGLTFYTELKPQSWEYNTEAMRVGCSGLHILKELRTYPHYDVSSPYFNPRLVLEVLKQRGESVQSATRRFLNWLASLTSERTEIVALTDTVFFDSAVIQYLFGTAGIKSPYGWSGIDLDSLYRGYARNMEANLRELGLKDNRKTVHCALDDAIFLADIARELIYNRLGEK